MIRSVFVAAVSIFGANSLHEAMAQGYPTRPVRMVVAMAPGGATDVVGRLLSQKLTEKLGQPVFIENRAGGGANIGTEAVARSTADGYTLLLATSTQTVNVSLYPKLPYDLIRDFVAVGLVATTPSILVVHPSVPVNSVEELVAYAKARPGKLTYASAGSGSATHLAGELFKSLAGIDLIHIPYKGSGPAMTDVLSGQVNVMFGFNPGQVMQYAKAGKLRPLAITTENRLSSLPTLRTMQEAGVPGFEASTWYGVLAPAGVTPEVVARLNAQIGVAVNELGPSLAEIGAYPLHSTPEQLAGFLKKEIAKWASVVQRSGAHVE